VTNKKRLSIQSTGLVRCQNGLEESFEAVHGVADHLQGWKDGRDEEMVVFLGETNLGAIADRK
jgi:hypothetical protein